MIRRLLVANRGEIARRVIRTCRDLGIETVAVHSDADEGAAHVRDADRAVRLPGSAPSETYLRVDYLVDAARWTGCDAVHPGYGFLAESPDLATAVEAAGLVWVGPPAASITAMGSKINAKTIMRSAGVPVLPDAVVSGLDLAELLAAGERVGFPLLVKASAGGGGRGMRVVRHVDDLEPAVVAASREAASAFGDGAVFLERYVEGGRHVEVQIVADRHGSCVSLFERDCSLQRRHQKIIEESPSPAVEPSLRKLLGETAVMAARAVGYVGAGTVELLLANDGSFSFLEMNTRLQVEHPVTELVTGLDLVALQLRVAEGRPLPSEALQPWLRGHAIEARLYAEDPAVGYRPQVGRLDRFEIPAGPHLRVDAGYEAGDEVTPHYDALLAKVVAWGANRDEALRLLRSSLAGARIHGLLTNREQLIALLDHPDVAAGRVDTQFVERTSCTERTVPSRLALASAAVAVDLVAKGRIAVQRGVPIGWRNVPAAEVRTTFGDHVVEHRFSRDGRSLAALAVDGEPLAATLLELGPGECVWRIGGVRQRHVLAVTDVVVHVDTPDGAWTMAVTDRFGSAERVVASGSLVAPLPGTVVRVGVAEGDVVTPGDLAVVLEAMKMEHEIRVPGAGLVADLHVAPGDQVSAGQVLLVITDAPA